MDRNFSKKDMLRAGDVSYNPIYDISCCPTCPYVDFLDRFCQFLVCATSEIMGFDRLYVATGSI